MRSLWPSGKESQFVLSSAHPWPSCTSAVPHSCQAECVQVCLKVCYRAYSVSQEDSSLLSKHLDEEYQTFLKEYELNLRLSNQAEAICVCWQKAVWVSDGSPRYLECSLLSERGYKSSSGYLGAMSFMILWFIGKEYHITQGHLQSPVVPSFKISLQQLQDWLQATL